MLIRCDACGAEGWIPAGFVGRSVRCKRCGGHFAAGQVSGAGSARMPEPPAVRPTFGALPDDIEMLIREAARFDPTPTPTLAADKASVSAVAEFEAELVSALHAAVQGGAVPGRAAHARY